MPPSRRRFLKTLPVALGAGVSMPVQATQLSTRISKRTLECQEALTGFEFNDAEHELMLGLVNANREHYDAIRDVNLPPETEPAFSFRPVCPRKPKPRATPNAKVAVVPPAGARVSPSIEQLAFESAARLGQLIAARAVSSTDLTRMYLDRLTRLDTRLS